MRLRSSKRRTIIPVIVITAKTTKFTPKVTPKKWSQFDPSNNWVTLVC